MFRFARGGSTAADWPEPLRFRTACCIRCHGARARQAAQLGSTTPLVKPRHPAPFPFWAGPCRRRAPVQNTTYRVYFSPDGSCPRVGTSPADLRWHGTWCLATGYAHDGNPCAYQREPLSGQAQGGARRPAAPPRRAEPQTRRHLVPPAPGEKAPTAAIPPIVFPRSESGQRRPQRIKHTTDKNNITLSQGKQRRKRPCRHGGYACATTTMEGERKHRTRQVSLVSGRGAFAWLSGKVSRGLA